MAATLKVIESLTLRAKENKRREKLHRKIGALYARRKKVIEQRKFNWYERSWRILGAIRRLEYELRQLRLLVCVPLVLSALLLTATLPGCLTISVKSPDGQSSASYTGTSIVGGEDVSCGSIAGVTSCSGSGQNVAGLAQAIAPYIAQAYGIPLPQPTQPPSSTPAATPTPSPAPKPTQ